MTTPRFSLLVPVKDGRGAKTRLAGVDRAGRAELMDAFARDAIGAALRTPLVEVHVVGDPASMAALATDLGVLVVPDEGEGDLNQALRRAAARVARPGVGLAVMLGDLPCLDTVDLERALAHEGRGYVADAAGTGTTLLFAPPGTDLDPRFGPESAAAHAASGATAVPGELVSLRLDVDTSGDLERAIDLGVGSHTTAVLARITRTERPAGA